MARFPYRIRGFMTLRLAMYLLVLRARSADGVGHSVYVWVDAPGVAQAENRARELAREEGWTLEFLESVMETEVDDYFRVCPSQQAFVRAKREGIAWRFNDQDNGAPE